MALTITDVLVGEVWLGSGQSNMAYQLAASNVAPETLAAAKAQAASVRPANPIISIENGAGLPLRPFRIDLKQALTN